VVEGQEYLVRKLTILFRFVKLLKDNGRYVDM
jgi:hypothetical protein